MKCAIFVNDKGSKWNCLVIIIQPNYSNCRNGGYFRYLIITNIYRTNGVKECNFFFIDFESGEVSAFLGRNFPSAEGHVDIINPDGTFYRMHRGYSDKILPSGEILVWNALNSTTSLSYSVSLK